MKQHAARQYTLRNVPEYVDSLLRQKAKATGKSLNQVALDALIAGSGQVVRPKRDYRAIIGSVDMDEASQLEEEIRQQRQLDPELWQ